MLPTTRLGWVAVASVMTLVLSTGVYAASTIFRQLFQTDPGLQQVELLGLGHDLNISQTVDGVTVTLGRAYADANRVVLAFTVRSEDGRQYTVGPANLTAINGTAFESTAGFGTVISPALNPPPGTPPMDLQPDEIGAVHSFDTTTVGGSPTALNLRLIADATTFLPDDGRNFVGPFTFDFQCAVQRRAYDHHRANCANKRNCSAAAKCYRSSIRGAGRGVLWSPIQ